MEDLILTNVASFEFARVESKHLISRQVRQAGDTLLQNTFPLGIFPPNTLPTNLPIVHSIHKSTITGMNAFTLRRVWCVRYKKQQYNNNVACNSGHTRWVQR